MKKHKRSKKYEVVPLDLPLDIYKILKQVAKDTNLTLSKVINVLLLTHIVKEENVEKN